MQNYWIVHGCMREIGNLIAISINIQAFMESLQRTMQLRVKHIKKLAIQAQINLGG